MTAAGTPPLSYQWRLNGTNLAGATGTSLTLSNVQPALAGNYTVRVTNAFGSAISSNAVLTVNQAPGCATPPAGLVGWWRGEGAASDSAGTNNGVLEGGVAFAAGEVGQAFSFNGTNADVRIAGLGQPECGTGRRIYHRDLDQSGRRRARTPVGGVEQRIVRGPPLDGAGAGPGSLWLDVKDTSFNDHPLSTAAGLLVSNVWQHVAATYDEEQWQRGCSILTACRGHRQTWGASRRMTIGDLYFGLRPYDGGAGARFAGLMDEVSLV